MKKVPDKREFFVYGSFTKGLSKILAVLIVIMLVGNSYLTAQEKQPARQITGKVVSSDDNLPIPGANVVIMGTQTGTVTDMDGNFSIAASSDDVLQVSFIGYLKEEITVGNSTTINVSLMPDIAQLDEVVVIGYGVQTKKLVTGATAHISGDDLQKRNSTNALQALQGQTPGINITSKSGQPGEGLRVSIRGLGTIGDANPLYIVDGVQTSDISYLNNADIESIDVLKDAASAAIYGSRAANGVVLITTKKGDIGRNEISFDAYYGQQNRAKKIDLLGARDYAIIMNEQHLNSGGTSAGLPFDVQNLPSYLTDDEGNFLPNANTNWLDEMFTNNAVNQNYTLGVTGGSKEGVYAMSLSYTGQEGIVGGRGLSNYDRYNGRFNSERNLFNGRAKIGQHLVYSYYQKNGVKVGNQYDNTLRGAFNASPILPMFDNNGEFLNTADTAVHDQNGNNYWYPGEANPYASMVYNNQNITATHKVVGDIYIELELTKNLKFRTLFGIDNKAEEYRSYTPIYELSDFSFSTYSKVRQKMSKDFTINTDNILTYDLHQDQHTINAMVGMSARKYTGVYIQGDGADLAFNDLNHAFLNNATFQRYPRYANEGKPQDEDRLLSYFGRVQYNYKETYLMNITFRADGSSRFAKGHQWGFFPSISAGWIISNEGFMQSTTTYLNYLKFRASWGQNGNQNIDAFQFLAPIKFTQAYYAFGSEEGGNTAGAYPQRLAYENIKWETSEQLDLGFDARLLNNKLAVFFDFYRKVTNDWLIKPPIYATAGAEAPFINGGKVANTGIELGLNYYKNNGNFTYNVGINGTFNRNNVEEVPTDDGIIHGANNSLYNNSPEFYRAETGHPIGYFWGYKMDGIFQSLDDVTNHINSLGVIIQPNAKPGDVRFVDQNDDGKLDDNDKIEIGDPNPDVMFGLTFSCNYKGFDFSALMNGVAGNQIVQSYRSQGDQYANYTTEILGRWNGRNTSNEIPRVTNGNINYTDLSSLYIKDGSYLRISDITLGYEITKIVKVKQVSQIRIYASVQNLYTFTKYNGMDPEVGYGFDHGQTDKFSSGIDLGYYPRPRTVLFGINVKF